MSVGVAVSVSIGVGVITTGISYFGCGFSLTRSLTLGVLAGVSAFGFLSLLTPLFAATTTAAGVTTPALLWTMPWFARIPALVSLTTLALTEMEVALNFPGYFYSPDKAKVLSSAWLVGFLKEVKGQAEPEEIMEAYLALANMLMYAAEHESGRYYMLVSVPGMTYSEAAACGR